MDSSAHPRRRKAALALEAPPPPAVALPSAQPEANPLEKTLAEQSPLHGTFARIYERLGGEDFIFEWAEDNPGQFIRLLTDLTPRPRDNANANNGPGTTTLELHMHPALGVGPLDITGQATVVDA